MECARDSQISFTSFTNTCVRVFSITHLKNSISKTTFSIWSKVEEYWTNGLVSILSTIQINVWCIITVKHGLNVTVNRNLDQWRFIILFYNAKVSISTTLFVNH